VCHSARRQGLTHAFTVDMEDWYQGIELPPDAWSDKERRLHRGMETLLALLEDQGVKATFFVLGVVAEEHPGLVRQVAEAGHEIGSHGYDHTKVYELDPARFRSDEVRTRDRLQDITGSRVTSYRSPYFSITRRSLWALEVLVELGYTVDASISAVETWRYGIAGAPDRPYMIPELGLTEVPPSTLRFLGRDLSLGGAYFRIFPYRLTDRALEAARAEGRPAVFYIHPWEFDPTHPRIPFERRARLTHYARLGRTTPLTRRLLAEHRFGTLGEMVSHVPTPLPEVTLATLAGGGPQ